MRRALQTRKPILSLALVLTFAGYPTAQVSLAQSATEADANEYVIYAALYKQKRADTPEQTLVINENTKIDDYFAEPVDANRDKIITRLVNELPPVMKETAEDFFEKNQKPAKLTDRFNLKAKVVLVSDGDLEHIFQASLEDAWSAFAKKYPRAGGIDRLSRVGFNKDKTQALLYYAYVCGGLCGQGQYVLLVNKQGEWKIEKQLVTWIS